MKKTISFQEVTGKLPSEGFVRLRQIVGDKDNAPIVPISKSAVWQAVREGRFPKPLKLGLRTTVWRVSDIRKFINGEV